MNTLLQSQVFFFISSIGFIFLWALLAVFLFYLIRSTRILSEIMKKIEEDVDSVGDTTKEMIKDIHDSAVFNFIFRKKKHKK